MSMRWSSRLFLKINSLVGRYQWLDAVGRSGAEWGVFTMFGWFVASDLIAYLPNRRAALSPMLFFGAAWALGWLLNIFIGLLVKEPRPHLKHPETRLLFQPLMSWKSFPSDHAMSAWLIFFMALVFGLPLAWSLFPLAVWVSWGRVYAGLHYPFDIVGGAAVAGLVAVLAWYVQVLIF